MKIKENRRGIRISFFCTEKEAASLLESSNGYKSVSNYVRQRVFKKGKGLLNPVDFIRALDEISLNLKRVGVNINQIAKWTNQRKDIPHDELMKEYNKLLDEYISIEKKLDVTFRKIMSL